MPASFPEIAPATLSGAEATYYTVTSGKKALKVEIWLCNTHTSAVIVSLYLVPSGGSISAANKVFADTVSAGRSVAITIACNLGASGTLRGLAGTASVVSLRLAPVEV